MGGLWGFCQFVPLRLAHLVAFMPRACWGLLGVELGDATTSDIVLVVDVRGHGELFRANCDSTGSVFLERNSLDVVKGTRGPLPRGGGVVGGLVLTEKILTTSLFYYVSLKGATYIGQVSRRSRTRVRRKAAPVAFSVGVRGTDAGIAGATFRGKSEVNLFTAASSNSVGKGQCVSGLTLRCARNSALIPGGAMFCPRKSISLSFVDCRPCRARKMTTNAPILPMSIRVSRDGRGGHTRDSFLMTGTRKVADGAGSMALRFRRGLSGLTVSLAPSTDGSTGSLLGTGPHVVTAKLGASTSCGLRSKAFDGLAKARSVVTSNR